MKRLALVVGLLPACGVLGGIDDPQHATADNPNVPHAETCATHGRCVLLPPFGWSEPALLWVGRADTWKPPECPPEAPVVAWDGWADFIGPQHECTPCECGEPLPLGTCELPTAFTAHASTCGSEGTATSLDAPADWDGSCTDANGIGIQAQCGAELCVQSVTVEPLTVHQPPASCAPGVAQVKGDHPAWGTTVRACRFNSYAYACERAGAACVPETPSGWARCIYRDGPHDGWCPDTYPFKATAYPEQDSYDDTRACTTCACGEATQGTCSSWVSLYYDWECSQGNLIVTLATGSEDAQCVDVLEGSPVRSKKATPPVFSSGSCEPHGGEPVGALTPKDAATFCCTSIAE